MIAEEENMMVAVNLEKFDKVLSCRCGVCNVEQAIFLNGRDYDSWKTGGAYIQDALPYLSADEREMLISYTCGKCFDSMFPALDDG
jgi:L-lactate utilization protein LutB